MVLQIAGTPKAIELDEFCAAEVVLMVAFQTSAISSGHAWRMRNRDVAKEDLDYRPRDELSLK